MTTPALPQIIFRRFGDDQSIRELTRPLSALEITRRSAWASLESGRGASPQARGLGAMIQRVNRKRGRYD